MNKKCPNCNLGELILIPADEPWNDEHYQCAWCDSAYTTDGRAIREDAVTIHIKG